MNYSELARRKAKHDPWFYRVASFIVLAVAAVATFWTFAEWDHSALSTEQAAVKKYLRDNSHDPSKLDFVEWINAGNFKSGGTWRGRTAESWVKLKYRDANVFGASVNQTHVFLLDADKNVVHVGQP